jgi:hypothetical protein
MLMPKRIDEPTFHPPWLRFISVSGNPDSYAQHGFTNVTWAADVEACFLAVVEIPTVIVSVDDLAQGKSEALRHAYEPPCLDRWVHELHTRGSHERRRDEAAAGFANVLTGFGQWLSGRKISSLKMVSAIPFDELPTWVGTHRR